jgi:hypothetical protein
MRGGYGVGIAGLLGVCSVLGCNRTTSGRGAAEGPPATAALAGPGAEAADGGTVAVPAGGDGGAPGEVECPFWRIVYDKRCTKLGPSDLHHCKEGDVEDCTTQCKHGELWSCSALGAMYAAGEGVAKDVKTAAWLTELACDYHYGVACYNRAGLFVEAGDLPNAAAYYDHACDSGYAMGCYQLGGFYQYGRGVKASGTRAVALYRKACDGGEAYACGCEGGKRPAPAGHCEPASLVACLDGPAACPPSPLPAVKEEVPTSGLGDGAR